MNKANGLLLAVAAAAMAFSVSCMSEGTDVPGTDGSSSSETLSGQSSSCTSGSSSSGEVQSSSSSKQSSSSSSSSSSSRQNTSSSSFGPPRNCDEGYDTEIEFCYSNDKVYPLCGTGTSGMYNPTATGCCNSVKFTLAAEACCNNAIYNKSTHGCISNTVLSRCGNNLYDPETHFCSGQVYEKCNGATFEPESEACINNVLLTRCGNDFYDPETHFCSGQIYKKCNGAIFDHERGDMCINNVLMAECGDVLYATETHFCSDGLVKEYSLETDSRDNKKYKTSVIGTQTWMAENLNYETKSGSWCYENKTENCTKYGRLYNWATAKTACPSGWHLPSLAEWLEMTDYIGGISASTKLIAARGWYSGGNGTDNYGFSALPGGYGDSDVGKSGYWWSDSEYESNSSYAYYRVIYYYAGTGVRGFSSGSKSDLRSVRCLKN